MTTTGWPPSELMQDDCKPLSKWLATRIDSRLHAREAAAEIAHGEDTLRMSTLLHAMGSMGEPIDMGIPTSVLVHPAAPGAVVSAPRLSLLECERSELPREPS